jgi:hypothetical protein
MRWEEVIHSEQYLYEKDRRRTTSDAIYPDGRPYLEAVERIGEMAFQ